MTFFIILAVFMAAIIFFHSMQGFFSATLSAIFAVFAAVFAVAYHESVVEKLLGGKVADEAHAMVLLALFAIIYLVLRIVFDSLISGNVRVPSTPDRIGAVIMGIVVAVFATGVMAIAAQELPFGISIAGYTRYDIQDDRAVVIPARHSIDSHVFGELTATEPGKFGDDEHGLPFLPVDDIVVGAVQKLSTGALSDGHSLSDMHPDLLQELFGQRMGIEAGANHVAMNLPAKKRHAVDVVGLYHRAIPVADQKDADFPKIRNGAIKPIILGPTSADMFLVVRVKFTLQAANAQDRIVRFSPGSARLVAYSPNPVSGEPGFVDYYPVGTLQDGVTLFWNKPDDYLYVEEGDKDRGADLVYRVPRKEFSKQAPPGTFIEIKRLARVDLSGMAVDPGPRPDPDFDVLRKSLIANPPLVLGKPKVAATPATPPAAAAPPPAPTNTFTFLKAEVSDAIPAPLSAPAGPADTFVQVPGGSAGLEGGKLKSATVDTTAAEQVLPRKITQFAVPANQALVQVAATPAASGPWAFVTEPEQFELVDSAGTKYQPYGAFAEFDAKGAQRYYLRYVELSTIGGQDAPDGASAPKRVTLFYLVPTGTKLTEFDEHGKKSHDISLIAK